jgi:FkbM family methyltransferase
MAIKIKFIIMHYLTLSISDYKRICKNRFSKAISKIGIVITTKSFYDQLEETFRQSEMITTRNEILKNDYLILKKYKEMSLVNNDTILEAFEVMSESSSQLRQDLFCLIVNGWKESGYFVDFGATNGKHLSNSWILEHKYKWRGIVAEPNPRYHEELKKNRKADIELACIWDESGELLDFIDAGELSKNMDIDVFDNHKRYGKVIQVTSISLNDLLDKYNAPLFIEYLSIDTEGSEYRILKALNFERFTFGCITVEHNQTKNRDLIFKLLSEKGYRRVLTDFSAFDDWYVHRSLALPI